MCSDSVHCSRSRTQTTTTTTTKRLNLLISKNNTFFENKPPRFVLFRGAKIKRERAAAACSGNGGAASWILMLFDAVHCAVCTSCCERLCDKGRGEHSALSCAVKGTECALIHKPSNCLQTRLQSSSIKTLCLAYQNKSQHRAEYQISPLERWSTRSLATSGI